MRKPARPKPVKKPHPSRVKEARRIIEKYASDLREIIKKLRRKMN